jgi:hypothetical protein
VGSGLSTNVKITSSRTSLFFSIWGDILYFFMRGGSLAEVSYFYLCAACLRRNVRVFPLILLTFMLCAGYLVLYYPWHSGREDRDKEDTLAAV